MAAVFYHRTEALTRFLLRKMLNLAQVWRIGKHLTYPTCAYGAYIDINIVSFGAGQTHSVATLSHAKQEVFLVCASTCNMTCQVECGTCL